MHAKLLADKENATVDDSITTDQDQLLTEVIKLAEKEGKPVLPIVVPTNNAPLRRGTDGGPARG